MDPADLAFAGVMRQAELVRSGEVSSRELVELYLERIERLQPQLNCFSKVMAERAMAEAQQADARRGARGQRPLLGVPMAVKEVHQVAGEVTTMGTAAHDGRPAARDSEIVRRIRAAGAVIIGKTTTPELAIMGDTEGLAFGVTRNPWDLDRSPGGSSGGSGAAVAAGLCAAATASDGAGSIRYPAANCGLFGLKPQRDRVSMAPWREHWHGLSVNGFEARSVRDTALLLDLAAEQPPERPFVEAAGTPPARLRVAMSVKPPLFLVPPSPLMRVDPELTAAVEDTAGLLRSLGHDVEPREPDYGTASVDAVTRFLRGIADDARAMARPDRLQRRTRGIALLGRPYNDRLLAIARQREAAHAERLGRLFRDHDVLLTPMTTRPPVRAARWEGLPGVATVLGMTMVYPFGVIWNMTGQPAAAVPAGLSRDGLPIAVQLVGRPGDEATLLSLAAQLEAERRWPEHRPPLA
jgi:amidase